MHKKNYQLYLFDFDGLLVNTEELHFLAYIRMCSNHGFKLPWDFPTYCNYAHFSATAIKEGICSLFPTILDGTTWEVLYQEKKEAYLKILEEHPVGLMPGAEALLRSLDAMGVPRCVVTHSPLRQIESIRDKNSILKTIPHWITREDYTHPKPSPEGYLKAIELYGEGATSIAGFEDSMRGLAALVETPLEAYLISSVLSEAKVDQIREELGKPFIFHSTLHNFGHS